MTAVASTGGILVKYGQIISILIQMKDLRFAQVSHGYLIEQLQKIHLLETRQHLI